MRSSGAPSRRSMRRTRSGSMVSTGDWGARVRGGGEQGFEGGGEHGFKGGGEQGFNGTSDLLLP